MFKLIAALLFSTLCNCIAIAVDLNAIVHDLVTTGVVLEVHGIDTESDRYVGTFRSKTDFFDFRFFALETKDPVMQEKLKSLKRHDEILVKGEIPSMNRPFLHIRITELTLTKPWPVELGKYPHGAKIPDAIENLKEMTVKVHASDPSGRMLVLEYQDSILPALVPKSLISNAAALDRGDLINVQFEIREDPTWPVHIEILDDPKGITVLEHMEDLHGKPVEYEGRLVLFPSSPQVKFNVFALQRDLGNGLKREYTIVNFQDPKLFAALRDKMQAAWDADGVTADNARNKLVKKNLHIHAKGTFNYVDKGQANPQVLIDDLKNIEMTIK